MSDQPPARDPFDVPAAGGAWELPAVAVRPAPELSGADAGKASGKIGNRAGVATVLLGIVGVASLWLAWVSFDQISVLDDLQAFQASGGAGDAQALIRRAQDSDDANVLAGALYLAPLVATAVVFVLWHRAVDAASRAMGDEPRVSRSWVTWGWIVPVISLVYPYRSIKDLAERNKAAAALRLLPLWWLLFLLASIIGRVSFQSGRGADVTLDSLRTADWFVVVSSLLEVVAAVLAVLVVRNLTRATQRRLAGQPTAAPEGIDLR
jgi:hypothetical protein